VDGDNHIIPKLQKQVMGLWENHSIEYSWLLALGWLDSHAGRTASRCHSAIALAPPLLLLMAARRLARAALTGRKHRPADRTRDIALEPRTRFAPKPFCTREVVDADVPLGAHRVRLTLRVELPAVHSGPHRVEYRRTCRCGWTTCRMTRRSTTWSIVLARPGS
jgi:hypothetical protein